MSYTKKMVVILAFLAAVIAVVSISGCTAGETTADKNTSDTGATLMVYCGAGLNEPMDEIATAFKEKYGVTIQYNFAGSNTLLSQMELTKKGDVFMPGSTEDFDIARNKSLVNESRLVVYHVPVIAVPAGNPANITRLEDLAKPGVRVVLGDNPACAIGKLGDKILEKAKIKAEVEKNVVARAVTVNELATYVTLGQADASIIWEDLYVPGKMEIIAIPKGQNIIKAVPIGVLTFSENADTARQFADYVASGEGKSVFAKHGFTAYPDARYEP